MRSRDCHQCASLRVQTAAAPSPLLARFPIARTLSTRAATLIYLPLACSARPFAPSRTSPLGTVHGHGLVLYVTACLPAPPARARILASAARPARPAAPHPPIRTPQASPAPSCCQFSALEQHNPRGQTGCKLACGEGDG